MTDLTKNYLFIFAHPDDESFYTGGTIAKIIHSGGNAHVVSLTHGERGNKHCGFDSTELKRVRKNEFHSSCQTLGATSFHLGEFRDGNLSNESPQEVSIYLDRVVDSVQPDAIITFGHEPHYPHRDHLATTDHVTTLYQDRLPIWYVVQSQENNEILQTLRQNRKKTPAAYAKEYEERQHNNLSTVTLEKPFLHIKYDALMKHTSQQPRIFIDSLESLADTNEYFATM